MKQGSRLGRKEGEEEKGLSITSTSACGAGSSEGDRDIKSRRPEPVPKHDSAAAAAPLRQRRWALAGTLAIWQCARILRSLRSIARGVAGPTPQLRCLPACGFRPLKPRESRQ